MSKIGVLFVCLGNICRSPTAEAVFRALAEREGLAHAFDIDSAGVAGEHAGESPDRRSQAAARRRGFDLSSCRARTVVAADFGRFDLLLAMDEANRRALLRLAPDEAARERVRRMLEPTPELGRDVPDPWYGGADGFDRTLDLLEPACAAWLEHLRTTRLVA